MCGCVSDFIKEHATHEVDGEPALTLQQVLSVLKQLPKVVQDCFPTTAAALHDRFIRCAPLYGRLANDRLVVATRTKSGSGRRALQAFARADVVTLLWDVLVSRLDEYVVALQQSHCSASAHAQCDSIVSQFASDSSLGCCLARIVCLEVGKESDMGAVSSDECAEHVVELCAGSLGVEVDVHLIHSLLAPICIIASRPFFLPAP